MTPGEAPSLGYPEGTSHSRSPLAESRSSGAGNGPPRKSAHPVATIDGIPVSRLSFDETLQLLRRWLGEESSRRVATANLDFLALARRDRDLRRALTTADLVTADGMPVCWLARLGRERVAERVAGSDLVLDLLMACAELGVAAYFLGGAPGSAERAAAKVGARLPSLRITGVEAPRVDLADDAGCRAIAARVRASGAALLLVGLGCPKQELFLERYQEASGCRVGIGVGGTFTFLAGDLSRAPRFLQRVGLEWLFRLAIEPRRLARRYWRDARYLVGAAVRSIVARPSRRSGPAEGMAE